MFLQNKNDVFDEIISMIKQCELFYDHKSKLLWSDHGTKFRNHTTERFCNENGIHLNLSIVHTPKKNGVEKNGTIIEANRTMVVDVGLFISLWMKLLTLYVILTIDR